MLRLRPWGSNCFLIENIEVYYLFLILHAIPLNDEHNVITLI